MCDALVLEKKGTAQDLKIIAFSAFVSKVTVFLDKLEGNQDDGKKKGDKHKGMKSNDGK